MRGKCRSQEELLTQPAILMLVKPAAPMTQSMLSLKKCKTPIKSKLGLAELSICLNQAGLSKSVAAVPLLDSVCVVAAAELPSAA